MRGSAALNAVLRAGGRTAPPCLLLCQMLPGSMD